MARWNQQTVQSLLDHLVASQESELEAGKLLLEKPVHFPSFFRLPLLFLSRLASSYSDRRKADRDVEVDIVHTLGNVEKGKEQQQEVAL